MDETNGTGSARFMLMATNSSSATDHKLITTKINEILKPRDIVDVNK